VGDFGITKRVDDDEIEGGDATYLAPELLDRSIGSVGAPADMFSLGSVFLQLMSFHTLLLKFGGIVG
jgi:serine/threonine protein kinase